MTNENPMNESMASMMDEIEKSMKKMKLIIGNALPLPEPNKATLNLQKSYNKRYKNRSTISRY